MAEQYAAIITCGLGQLKPKGVTVGQIIPLNGLTGGKAVKILLDSRVVAIGETVYVDGLPGVRITAVSEKWCEGR